MCRHYHLSMEWCRQCPQCVSQRSKLGKRRSPLASLTIEQFVSAHIPASSKRFPWFTQPTLKFIVLRPRALQCLQSERQSLALFNLPVDPLAVAGNSSLGLVGMDMAIKLRDLQCTSTWRQSLPSPEDGAGAKFLRLFIFFCQWLILTDLQDLPPNKAIKLI